jgi:hypothetical protein
VLKGIGSQDGLEFSLHAWVHLGLKKGCGRFWNFSDVPIPEKMPYIYFFLEGSGKPTSLCYFVGVYLVIIISLWLVQQVFDSHWMDECANYTWAWLTIDQSYAAWD